MIEDDTRELAALWPALAAALARDTAALEMPGGHTWAAATVVNADVLAAMITLSRDIPAVTAWACDQTGEPPQRRDLPGCLRALPRLASRLHDLDLVAAEKHVTGRARDWLRLTKRALGLRKPDIPLRDPDGRLCQCPWAESRPDNHQDASVLIVAGDEGFLRAGPDGFQVEWVLLGQIYCPAKECGASWGPMQWRLLERMLRSPDMVRAG